MIKPTKEQLQTLRKLFRQCRCKMGTTPETLAEAEELIEALQEKLHGYKQQRLRRDNSNKAYK